MTRCLGADPLSVKWRGEALWIVWLAWANAAELPVSIDAAMAANAPGIVASSAPAAEIDLAVFPGFERQELELSVNATLKAMGTCVRRGQLRQQPEDRPTHVPYVAAVSVDGTPVSLLMREVEWRCRAKPLRRCTGTYIWDPNSPEISYASLQCYGAYDAPYAYYLVTAVRDLKKADKPGRKGTPKDKALVTSSVSFQTTEFPGTHVVAYAETSRKDKSDAELPRLTRFDDYQAVDSDEAASPISSAKIHQLADTVNRAACWAVRACGEL